MSVFTEFLRATRSYIWHTSYVGEITIWTIYLMKFMPWEEMFAAMATAMQTWSISTAHMADSYIKTIAGNIGSQRLQVTLHSHKLPV